MRAEIDALNIRLENLIAKQNPIYDTLDDEGNIVEEESVEEGRVIFSAATGALQTRVRKSGHADNIQTNRIRMMLVILFCIQMVTILALIILGLIYGLNSKVNSVESQACGTTACNNESGM